MSDMVSSETGLITNDGKPLWMKWKEEADRATARAEQAEADAEYWRMETVNYLKSIDCPIAAITNSGTNMHWASILFGRIGVLEKNLETARRALEAARRYAGCKPRGAEENELLDKIANALATLTAPDGQQVTADGHVADEAALEVSNEAIRPKCQERLDTFTRMANGEKLG